MDTTWFEARKSNIKPGEHLPGNSGPPESVEDMEGIENGEGPETENAESYTDQKNVEINGMLVPVDEWLNSYNQHIIALHNMPPADKPHGLITIPRKYQFMALSRTRFRTTERL